MARPTDWDAIGLSGDPTPGDPEQIRQLSTELKTMGDNARDISAAIDAVMNIAGDSVFVGQAADALRGKVDNRLRGHIEDVAQSFEKAADALTTWADKLVELQARADGALNAGRGLSADDPQRETYATTARGAGTEHGEGAGTAASNINGVANIQLPISQCQVFWEAFQWLAIILIIPALIFGGPIALLALGVNLTLFIKTIVDFAKGDANFLDLFLAGLGIIAPTTKALPIFQIIKAGGTAFAKGFKAIASTAFQALRNLFTNGFRFTTIMPGLRDFVHLSTTWIKAGGLWVMQGVHNLPGLAGMVIQRGGITVVQGLRGIPGVVRGLPEIISGGLAAGWKGLGRGLTIGWEGLTTGAKATYDFGVRELGGGKWLRLLLPVDAGEIGQFGLGGALRIGFIDRGLMGQHIFGAPLANAVGHGVSAVPIPHGGPHGLDALVDMPRVELGNVRLGDWAGTNAGMRPFDLNLGPVDLASALRSPSLHMGNVGAIGERAGLGFHASRQLDALVDIPKAHLNNLELNGGFTPLGGRTDAGLGVSAASSAPSLHSSGLYLPGSAGAPAVQGVNLATGTPLPGAAHSALTAVQAPPPGAVSHLDTLLPGTAGGAHSPANVLLGGVQAPPPGTAAAGNLLTPGTPGAGNGMLHSAVTGAQAPPPVTAAGHDLTAGITPGGAAAGGHVPVTGIGQAHHGANGTGGSALDLLAAGGRNTPQSPVPAGTGAQFGDRAASALTANQTRLHLDELVHTPGSPRAGAVPDRLVPGSSAANGPTPSPVRLPGDTLPPVDGTRAAALDLVESGPGLRPADTHAFAGAPARTDDAGHAFAGAPAGRGEQPVLPAAADLHGTPVRPGPAGRGPHTPDGTPPRVTEPALGTAGAGKAPASVSGGGHVHSHDAELFHEVNIKLRKMGHEDTTPGTVSASREVLENIRGAGFTKVDVRAQADQLAVHIAGPERGRLPGGVRETDLGHDASPAPAPGTGGHPAPPAPPRPPRPESGLLDGLDDMVLDDTGAPVRSRFDFDDDSLPGSPVSEHGTEDLDGFSEFVDLVRPLRQHVEAAIDHPAANIEVALVASPGGRTWREFSDDVGHAMVSVLLPGEHRPLTIGFYPENGHLFGSPGAIVNDAEYLLSGHVRVLGTYRITAAQLFDAYRYAMANSGSVYDLFRFNCVRFAEGFVSAALGKSVADLWVAAPYRLVDTMLHRDGAWHWADGTGPVAKLTADDTIRYQNAFGEVEDWRLHNEGRFQAATDQAKTFVLFDHQRPLIDGNLATASQKERLFILDQFEKMITHTILTSGDDAGRQLSRQLGESYGTLRPGLADLPGPSVAAPAAGDSLTGIGRGSVGGTPDTVPSPGPSTAGDSAGHTPESLVRYPSDVQHLFGEIDDMLQDMGLFRHSVDDLAGGSPPFAHGTETGLPGGAGHDVRGAGGNDVGRFMDDTLPVRQHLEHAIADPSADIRLVVGTDGTTGARSLTVWLPGRDAPVPLGPGAPGDLGAVRGTLDGTPSGGPHALEEHRITAAQLENAYLYAARNLPLAHTDAGRFTDGFMDAVLDARPAAHEPPTGTPVHNAPDAPPAVAGKGKAASPTGTGTVDMPHTGSHHGGPAGSSLDELSHIDSATAITDARRELINARIVRDDLQTRYVEGLGTSAEVDGVRYLESWEQVRQADAALTQAEAHWSEVTGGAPLPEVQSYRGRGLGGGAPQQAGDLVPPPGGDRPVTAGDDLANAGTSGSHQPAPLPPVDNRSVVGVPGQDGFVVRAERGKTPELVGNPVVAGHHFDVADVQRGGAQFTVRELDAGGTVVHSWTYKRLGPALRTAEETAALSGGHFAGAEIKIAGSAVADVPVGGTSWPAKLVGDGEIHVASPLGNQVYDRVTGTLTRTETSGRPPVEVPGSVPPGEAGNWTAAADLARAHLGRAAVDNDLKLFMQNVIGGAFTSKKGYGGYLNAGVLEANPGLIGKVEEFNKVTKGLLHEGANEPMTVWRGVAMDPHAAQADVFIERLPASTSNNRGFQAEWAKNGVNSNRVVFEIEVPANHGKLAMDYPPGYQRASDDVAVALSDQSEVTLSPTRLVRTGSPRVEPDGITVIPVRAEQIPNAELPALLREEWQGLPSGTAFEDFGRAFEQGAVRRWEGLDDAIVRTEGTNPNVREFVVSRPGYTDELTVTVTHDADRNAVKVEITGGDRAFTKEWSGTGFSNLAADLRGTVLHNNDLFNPLPTPASWKEAPASAPVRSELSRETDLFHTVNLRLQKLGEGTVTRAEFQQAYHVVQDRLGTLEGRLTVRALTEDVTAQLLGHEFPRLRGGMHPTANAGDDLATAGPSGSGSGSHQAPSAAPAAHTPVDLASLNNALEVHAGAASKLRQVENDLAQLSDNSPKLSDAQAKVDDAVLDEQKATAALDGAVDDLIGSRNLTQVELNSLVDRLAGSSYVDQAVRLRAHGDDLDRFARTPQGAGRPDQGVWTGPEIRTQAGAVRVRVADLENALLPGSQASRVEIQGLVDELRGSAGRLGVMTDGFVKDAARFGGAYALRAQNKALVVAANHYAKLVDDALAAARPGEAVQLSESFLVGKAARGLSGGAVDVVRRYRVWGAYKDVPTGHQWRKVLPDAEGKWAQAIGDFPDNLTPTQKGEFVKNLSGRNIRVLREEFDALLGKMDAGDAQALRDLRARVENLPHHVKHATPAYHTMANSGFMMSQGELERRGLKFLASGKSSVKNTSNLGNDDFVFFRMESGKAPMQTRYGPTTMIFDAKVLEERGGWVSLHDQLNPLDRPTMRNLEFGGESVRKADFDDGFKGTGERARWTYTYPDNSTRTVSFEQEVFHGAEVREGLALSVVREVQSIGGDFKAHALRVMDNPDELGKVVSDLFRPEAKFGGNLPFTPLGSEVSGRWAGLVDVHNPAGDGRYLPDGTVDPFARAAGKQHDEALDKVRQADNGIASGHTNSVRFNLRKAETHAQQSVDLTKQFQSTATGDRLVMANDLLAERTKLLHDIKSRLAPAPQAAPPAQPPVAALGTAGAQPPAGAVASVEDLLQRPAPRVEGALNDAAAEALRDAVQAGVTNAKLVKVTPHMVSVGKVLTHSDGFRPLLNSKVDLETQAAFGLSKNQFSKAFSALDKLGLVRGADDGLHLTDKGRGWLLPPGTATDVPPPVPSGSGVAHDAPTSPAVAHEATTTPPPAGTHGGADPWARDTRAVDDLLGGPGQPARQHYADLTAARTDLGKAEEGLHGTEAGTSQHVSAVDQHHQGEVLAARGREADAFHQLQDTGVDPLAVDGRMHELNHQAAVERGAVNAGSRGNLPPERVVPVSTHETPLSNSGVSGQNGLIVQRSTWENGDRTFRVLGNDLAEHPDYTVTVRRDGGFDVRHAPSDSIATYNDSGLRIAHDLPLVDSAYNATGSRLHVELNGRGHATDATVTGPGGQHYRVELFRGDVVRVTDELGAAARWTTDGRPWDVLGQLDGPLAKHTKAVEELQGVEQQLAQKTEAAGKDGKAVTGAEALQEKVTDFRGKETLARQAVTDAVQDLMDARYLAQDEVNHLVERFAGLGDIKHAEMLQAHGRELDALSRATAGEEPGRLWQRIWTGREITDQSAEVENRAVRLYEALRADHQVPPGQLRVMAGELHAAADDLDTGLRGFVKDAAGFGGVYGLRNAHTPWAAVGRHFAKLVDEAAAAAPSGARVTVRNPLHPQLTFAPREAVDRTRVLTDMVRQYRTDEAFKAVPTGTQWKAVFPGTEGQWTSVFGDFGKLTPQEQTAFVRTLSEANVRNLRAEVDSLLAAMPDPVRAQFVELGKQLDAVPYHVKHATPAYRAIENSGQMASQGELGRRGQKFYASGKSSLNNTSNLGNDDFVFFRMESGDAPMQTRYGPTTLVFDAKVLEERGGWVSLHDQLNPLDRPAMQSLEHGGHEVRGAAFPEGATGTGARSRWTYTYPDGSKRLVSFEQEVFHGAHVREGITLSVMREVASIGGDFQNHVLGLLGKTDELGRIVTRMYRPEAKFGGSLPITAEGAVARGEWPTPVKVWNADGDGRYFPDGTVDPVARASGKQFDLASDRLRQAQGGVDSIEQTGKRLDLSDTERAKRITGMERNVRFNLRKAHQHVTTSIELTNRFHASAEGARKALAQRLLDERGGLLGTIEEKLGLRKTEVAPPPAVQLSDGEILGHLPDAGPELRQVIRRLVENGGSIELAKFDGTSIQQAFGVGRNKVDKMLKMDKGPVYGYVQEGAPGRVIALSDTAREWFLSGRAAPDLPAPSASLGAVTHEVPAPAVASGSGLRHSPAPAGPLHDAPAPKPVVDAFAGGSGAELLPPPKPVDDALSAGAGAETLSAPKPVDGVLSRPGVLDDLLAGPRDGGPVRHVEETRPLGTGSGTDAVPPPKPLDALPSRPALIDELVVRPEGTSGRPVTADRTVTAGTGRPAHPDLLDADTFQSRTATRTGIRSRSQINPVDQAVNDLQGVPETDFARRADALDRVVTAADEFLRVRPGSDRAPGVRDLRNQARDEAAVYRALDDVHQGGSGDLARGARSLLSGDTLRAGTRGHLEAALTRIDRADDITPPWADDYRAVDDLLGGEGSTARQHWADLTSARTDLGRAEDGFRGGDASTSQGLSAVDEHVMGEVLEARGRLAASYHQLREEGLDPHAVDEEMRGINERAAIHRGAVNAAGGGDTLPERVPVSTTSTHLSDSGHSGPNGFTVQEQTWADGSVTHQVVDRQLVPDPDRTVTLRQGGGFDVRHTPTDVVVTYNQAGARIADDVPLRGADGLPTGARLHVDLAGRGGPQAVHAVDGQGHAVHAVLLDDAHVRVTDTGTGVTTRVTVRGQHVDQGLQLTGRNGVPADADRVLMTEGAGHHVTDLHGNRLPGTVTDLGPGNGFRVTDDATGAYAAHGADGRLGETGVALADAGGARGAVFVADRPGGQVLTDAGGVVRGERLTVLPNDAGFRVTDDVTGATTRYGADGRRVETGVALADAEGARGAVFVADRPGGQVLTDAAGVVRGERLTVLPDNAGFRVTDDVTGATTRYGAGGRPVETGVALVEPATGTRGGRVAVPDDRGGHRLTDNAGVALDDAVTTLPRNQGLRIANRTGYDTFGPDGAVTGDGLRLTGRDGRPAGHVDRPVGGAARWLDDAFAADAGRALTHRTNGDFEITLPGGGREVFDRTTGRFLGDRTPLPGGGHQVTAADGSFGRYDGTGVRTADGTPLPGEPGGRVLVTQPPTAAAPQAARWLEDGAGNRLAHWDVTLQQNGAVRAEFTLRGTPRHGEFVEVAADGTLARQSFNVVDKGRATGFRYEVDHVAHTWRRTDAAGNPVGSGSFHRGAVDRAGEANGRVRLLSTTKGAVPVFERRLLPGGDVLDAFRRTDTIQFGRTNARTSWARWDHGGRPTGSGTRHYDTAGTGWRDKEGLQTVREYRDGLQKYDGRAGHTLAERGADGTWTWHRYDGAARELDQGPRTRDFRDSGWTDRNRAGAVVQRQWGMGRLPDDAGQYQEWTLTRDGTLPGTWERQSPHGKETGKREVFGDGHLTTERWREQRPPSWVRNQWMPDAGRADAAFAHVLGDGTYQMFTWVKESPTARGSGVRYVGFDGGIVDLAADGSFARSVTKLHDGTTLKAGDNARPPAAAHVRGNGDVPWEAGGTSGYRVRVADSPDGIVWRDEFLDGTGRLRVAREGLPGGVVREYADPPAVGDPVGRGTWVSRDAHGNLTGQQHPDPNGAPNSFVRGTGGAAASRWTWRQLDGAGTELASGRREFFRGSHDARIPWDDSYRDFDRQGNLVRERRMLDSGRYVDAWRDPAPGGNGWLTAKFERNGTRVDPGAGQQIRTWWNGRAWQDQWTTGARHFRDELVPPPGQGGVQPAAVRLRETPVHSGGPLRVREFDTGAATAHSVWKEFDHGAVVRQRAVEGQGFLETDAWRGQWNRYDGGGRLVAQRTDNGLVFETDALGRMRLVGNEYDFRGPLTEIRGWGRRVREAQRMPWSGTALPEGPGAGAAVLREARYQPYWQTVAYKAALEFGQEFILEFGANLIVNGIVAAVQDKPFTGKEALKAFANAAVGATVKTGLSTAIHENRGAIFRDAGSFKAGWANIDSGKHWNRRPGNHDKNWANEWGGNETPTRWRGGIYDFSFSAGSSVISGWINGSMNAAVWGITNANGETVKLHGADAFLDGGINALAALTTASSTALVKNIFVMGGGSRLFHRQGFAEFWIQLPFKIFEKTVQSLYLTNLYRASIDPAWRHHTPPPTTSTGQNK
ncbi:hypothetical protein [Streptomyces sp. NPDC088733]|uniref:hypothetical protein n=1 Tax=Streptomyces sp. NPDC088733 TaxID=3365880 RepID=UPI0038281CA7